MATFDSLAGDQRAVLQLVLGRRRGYEEIAGMLSLSPEAVRGRALGALDALGPATELGESDRRLIGDYLLSQLPDSEADEARALLARSPAAREWALGLTPALEPVSVDPLPRIPPAAPQPAADERPASSRTGGMVVIGLAVAVIIAAVVVLLVTHHPHHANHSRLAAAGTTDSTGASTSTTSTTSTTSSSSVKALAQINLKPTAAGSRAIGAVVVFREGTTLGIEMLGQHIPPNTKRNSYEVWLYSSPTRFRKLGFVSPAVGKNGRFSVVNALPANADSYHELIVTTETARQPTHPGPVLLAGTIPTLS